MFLVVEISQSYGHLASNNVLVQRVQPDVLVWGEGGIFRALLTVLVLLGLTVFVVGMQLYESK